MPRRMRMPENLNRERGAPSAWILEFDPCDAPMARGARLSMGEMNAGLRTGAFLDGMRFERRGRRYVVQAGELKPFRRPR